MKDQGPPKVAFFSWTAALGKNLTTENLRHRGIILVNWCCMCKIAEESVDHLLLHCTYARELWDMIFVLFGVYWVMPRSVMALFDCWLGSLGRHQNVPHCVLWCLWRERNASTFEGCETSVVDLKLHFYRLLLDWLSVTGLFNFTNVIDLIDSCSF